VQQVGGRVRLGIHRLAATSPAGPASDIFWEYLVVSLLKFEYIFPFPGVIPSEAAFQAERGISRCTEPSHARSLVPLVKARDFEMTPVCVRFQTEATTGNLIGEKLVTL